jgi:hypothetical protein
MKGYFRDFWNVHEASFKTPEKVGGEEVLIPLKNEAKIKIKWPLSTKEGLKGEKQNLLGHGEYCDSFISLVSSLYTDHINNVFSSTVIFERFYTFDNLGSAYNEFRSTLVGY